MKRRQKRFKYIRVANDPKGVKLCVIHVLAEIIAGASSFSSSSFSCSAAADAAITTAATMAAAVDADIAVE